MNLVQQHNANYNFFSDITGVAMKVHSKYHSGLMESAYFKDFEHESATKQPTQQQTSTK